MRYEFAEFELDLDTGELQQGQVVVPLRRQTLRLLQALVSAAPALLTRDQLLDEVWGRSALSPNVLPQAISELRRALGDDAEAPRFIETRRGLGYRFIAEVFVLEDPAPRPQRVEQPRDAAVHAIGETSARKAWVIAAGMLTLVVIILGSMWMLRAPPPLDQTSSVPASTASQPKVALAIAPFPADSAVADWVPLAALELFAQSLRSERLTLYRSDTLGVSPQQDAARWQHQAHDLLGASHALSGRWHAAEGGALQLDVSLLDLATGQILGSRRFAAASDDVDRLVAQASELIANTLRVAVGRPRASGEARLDADDRKTYWSALSSLAQDDAANAATALSALYSKLGQPVWIEPDLARALHAAQQYAAAQALLESRLKRRTPLPLGERLRIQAELAGLRHQPAEVAAARRALVELYPEDVENWIGLIDAELDALQGASARATMVQLTAIPHAQTDPRFHVLRARLALLDNSYVQAQAEADLALQQAVSYDLPSIAIAATLTHADSLNLQGELTAAEALLDQADREWSGRITVADHFALRIRHAKLLRVRGDLSTLAELLVKIETLAASPSQQVQLGVEKALLQSLLGQHEHALAAINVLEQAVVDAGDPALRISWHDARAVIALAGNDVDLARQEFDAAFAVARHMGQERFSVPLQVNAGTLLARQRRFAEADVMWNSALEVFAKLGDRRGQATCLGNLAASASIQGRLEQSRELSTKALKLFREMGVTDAQARTAYNLAVDAARFGEIADAAALFAEARVAWLAGAQLDMAIRAAVGEAELNLLTAKPVAALAGLDALAADENTSAFSRAALRAVRAKVVLAQGDLVQAQALQSQALALRQQAGSEAWTSLSELELLRSDWLQGADSTRVQVSAEALAQRFSALREPRDAARAWLLVAEARLDLGQRAPALHALDQVQKGINEFPDRPLELDLAWVSAWAAPPAERSARLDALRKAAMDQGYLLAVATVDAATSQSMTGDGSDESLRIILPPYAAEQD